MPHTRSSSTPSIQSASMLNRMWNRSPCRNMYVTGCHSQRCRTTSSGERPRSWEIAGNSNWTTNTRDVGDEQGLDGGRDGAGAERVAHVVTGWGGPRAMVPTGLDRRMPESRLNTRRRASLNSDTRRSLAAGRQHAPGLANSLIADAQPRGPREAEVASGPRGAGEPRSAAQPMQHERPPSRATRRDLRKRQPNALPVESRQSDDSAGRGGRSR